jgi:hypothetical protein
MTASAEGHAANPPSRPKLALMVAGGFVVASLITVCAVLPAEFHLDPTGLGTATGLMGLSAAPEAKSVSASPAAKTAPGAAPVLAREYPTAFRSDTIDIPLKGAESTGSELEYKVKMKAGQTLIYSWSVQAPPEEFYYDFHSQEWPQKGPKEVVISHKSGVGVGGNGAMVAPFDGIHGWYLQNQSVKPVVVRLKLSGFYELLPNGQPPA